MSTSTTRTGRGFAWMLLSPTLLFLIAFLVVPGVLLAALSLRNVDAMLMIQPGYGWSQYLTVFGTATYASALWTTLWVSLLTAALCVLLGYPAAWMLANAPTRTVRTVLYVLLVSPLLTSVVIRTFAWIVLLAQNGLINDALLRLGIIDAPLRMLWNMDAVIIAYVQVMLPFAVLPIATSLQSIPPSLSQASMSLGASRVRTFFQVTLPLTFPGMMTGAIIVFALAAGSYITPLLIGGRLQPLLPITIYQQAVQIANLPLAAALSITLLFITGVVVFLMGGALKRWEKRTYG